MAYNHGAPHRAPQRPQYDRRAMEYESSRVERHDADQRGYGRYDNMNGHIPQHGNDSNSQNDYTGYNKNQWGDGGGSYGNSGYDRHENRQWKRHEDRPFVDRSGQKFGRPRWNGREDSDPHRRPNMRPRPSNNTAYQQHETHNSHGKSNHNDQHQSGSSQGLYYNSQNDHGNDQKLYHTAETNPPPRTNEPMNHVCRDDHTSDNDSLPRYLNSDSSGTSQHAPPGTRNRVNDDTVRDNDSSAPQQYQSIRNVDRIGETAAPSRSKISHGQQKFPEALAWDNPFPTFPSKPRNRIQRDPSNEPRPPNRTGSDNSISSFQMPEDRPHTAHSKGSQSSSYNSTAQSIASERHEYGERNHVKAQDANRDHVYQQRGGSEPLVQSSGNLQDNMVGSYDAQAANTDIYDKRKRAKQPGNPFTQGRQSEDNRARPAIPVNGVSTSGYERSRTMPATLQNAFADSGLIPVNEQSVWQEPGAVSGYYGPEDKVYLPNGPNQDTLHRPRLPPKSQSYDNQWETKDVAKTVQTHNAPQQPTLAESGAEIHDAYREEPLNHYEANPREQDRSKPSPSDEEMPNFGTSVTGASHQRRATIDQHLGPRLGPHEQPTTQATEYRNQYNDYRHQQNSGIDAYTNDHFPRSQSQPGYSERWPPPSHQHNEFDFGVPGPMDRRPATSASSYYRDPHIGRTPADRLVEPRHPQDPRQRPRNNFGPGLKAENRQYDQHKGPGSYRIGHETAQPPQPDRHCSPQVQSKVSPSERTQQPFSKPPPRNLGGPTPPQKPLPNPDALPHHPAPVRPGLAEGLPSSQPTRPIPIRQYNNAPQDPVHQSASSHLAGRREVRGPVTLQDLESLKQKTYRNPNDSEAQFLLAKKLVEAADVLVDERGDPGTKRRNREKYHSDALKIIKKLSAISYTEADFYYADCYSRGALGLQPDIKEAFILYQKSAKANHAQAAYRVAVCCELGQEEGGGTKRDAVKAMQWYRRAATLGDVAAMYKMGVIQLKGLLGQPKDPRDAVNWLKRAAERADKENPHALHELALLHEKPTGVKGISQDEAYSRTLFTQAANLGYKFSQFRLGCAYEYGLLGCPVDPRQSIAWYSKAAVQDEHQSELALSGWYLTGSEGVLQQSDTEAYLWARKAAQAGLAKAEYAMGYFTEVGIGAPANLEDAKRWYWKSASQNFPKARDRLEDLRKGGASKPAPRISRSNIKKQSDGECVVM